MRRAVYASSIAEAFVFVKTFLKISFNEHFLQARPAMCACVNSLLVRHALFVKLFFYN
jgi:hypothetical protein